MRKYILAAVAFVLGFAGGCWSQKARIEHTDTPETLVINRPSGDAAEPRSWVTLRVLPAGGEPGPAVWIVKLTRGDETVKVLRCLPVTE